MNKKWKLFAVLIVILSLVSYGCKTKPDKPETTTTTTTVDSKKLTPEEIKQAQDLIDQAKAEDAETHDPENLKKAVDSLAFAVEKNESDYEAARKSWLESMDAAKAALENSLMKKALAKKQEAIDKLKQLKDAGADKEYPEDYNRAVKLVEEGNQSFDAKDYKNAYNKYSDSVDALNKILEKKNMMSGETEQRINYIRKLIADAEKLGANEYAKEDLNNAISELEKGVNYHQNKDKENTKISLDAAEKSALKAIELTKAALKEKKRKEALKAIMDAGKTVEDASKKKVINEEGEAEKSSDYKFEFDEGKKDLNRAPDTGMSYKDLLNKAIDYVEKAKEAYRNEDYELAIHYAQLAKKIAENYQGGGIKLYYTVRLIPERRDCLWRISEYPEIYNDPFLWPMIWKANKREILNPDLIFPGQVFAVPDVD